MNHQINLAEIKTSILIVGALAFFYLYYYFAYSTFLKKTIKKFTRQTHGDLLLFFAKKLSGFLFLGIIPGLLYYFLINPDFEKFGFSIPHFKDNFLIILILVLIIIFVLYLNQLANTHNNSLQINRNDWTVSLFTFNAVGWIIYLIGYEFLFRGILLFECFSSFGFWPAIAINVAIYSAIHLVNGKDQAIGALIFGTIACYFTLTCETILIPIFMHITLSLFSDYFSIQFNKKLSFVKSGKNNPS